MPTIQTTIVGNCYDASYDLLFTMPPELSGLVLVHGYPICTGEEHRGKKMGHAWLEVFKGGWQVIGHNMHIMDRELFYDIGKIRFAECKRYTMKQAAAMAIKYGNKGPWGRQPKDAYFAEMLDTDS